MMHGMLERILYVEDEPDIRAVAKIALETVGGFVLNTCNCGTQALQEAEGFKPDLLLLDVMMGQVHLRVCESCLKLLLRPLSS